MGKRSRRLLATAQYSKARRRRKSIGGRQRGIGKICGGGKGDNFGGAAAFPNLTKNAVCVRQMRSLDFVRERALGAVRRVLGLKKVRGLGLPSSYYGYLMKVERPAQGRRRVWVLPYSEL